MINDTKRCSGLSVWIKETKWKNRIINMKFIWMEVWSVAKIHVLSEHLTNMIAAGEVGWKTSWNCKGCVENSIVAGATVIEVEVFQGGIERIVITDDGCGMDHEDAHLAFMRHATSKMHSEEELFNIQTMGFRGEAYQVLLLLPKSNYKRAMVKKVPY